MTTVDCLRNDFVVFVDHRPGRSRKAMRDFRLDSKSRQSIKGRWANRDSGEIGSLAVRGQRTLGGDLGGGGAGLDAYIRWYNEVRVKISLGSRSPVEYRRKLGIAA